MLMGPSVQQGLGSKLFQMYQMYESSLARSYAEAGMYTSL